MLKENNIYNDEFCDECGRPLFDYEFGLCDYCDRKLLEEEDRELARSLEDDFDKYGCY